ncbi:MAG: helix-hairpin-helix domain-containing protein [Thiohalospira sp.]
MFNIGRKDEHGRQKWIQHSGRHLRVSRTGGVALRARTRAAGINLTANTARGVRLSTSAGPGTQVAVQNGRFILRGRYKAGPLRLNLSKSGLSLSGRNNLGAFNITNPNRSSAKIAGIQMRGRKAAQLQGVYMALVAIGEGMKLLAVAAVGLIRFLIGAIDGLLRLLLAIPSMVARSRRALRNGYIRWRRHRLAPTLRALPGEAEGALAALWAVHLGWGRGYTAEGLARILGEKAPPTLAAVAPWLDGELADALEGEHDLDAVMAHLAEVLRREYASDALPELLLAMDEAGLVLGRRTRRQDRLLEVFADFAGLRMEATEEEAEAGSGEKTPEAGGAERVAAVQATPPVAAPDAPDINSADAESLATLPGIGPARARDIIAHRPFGDLDALQAVSGIGPATVARLREAGVRCE